MSWYLILFAFLTALGAASLAFQTYKMTKLDAESRGFKHPKWWGLFSLSGQGSSGLVMYLIGRRKYPSNMSESDHAVMESRKKKAIVSLVLLALASFGLITFFILHIGMP